jgi:hypothetical protein
VSAIPPDEVLPCGCVLRCAVVDGVNTLTVTPCRQTCRNYLNLLGMAVREEGKLVEYRTIRGQLGLPDDIEDLR